MTQVLTGLLLILLAIAVVAYAFGWRFKKVTWNWTSLIIGLHAGRNPATGARFAYIGLGYGLGLDFHKPEEPRARSPYPLGRFG